MPAAQTPRAPNAATFDEATTSCLATSFDPKAHMLLQLHPGNALCCPINAHRNGWDATICNEASSWECGAPEEFRQRHCDRGHDRCFHMRTFSEEAPGMQVEQSGGHWLLEHDITALDDQIVLFWGSRFSEPRGISPSDATRILYGAYRVQKATPITLPYRTNYRLDPHEGEWCRVANLGIRMPYQRPVGGKYFRQVDRDSVLRLFEELTDAASRADAQSWRDNRDPERLQSFTSNLESWLATAADRAERFGMRRQKMLSAKLLGRTDSFGSYSPLSDIKQVASTTRPAPEDSTPHDSTPPASEPPTPEPAATPEEPAVADKDTEEKSKRRPDLVEQAQIEWIETVYGSSTLQALRTAALTKPLVILRGDPGVGKSHLAVRILDDPERSRTCIVPVGATWRGREDLLGYVNPVTGWFEASPFTLFLVEAEKAWQSGDTRARLAIFEEFNLSQPEHWLADILVASQFQDACDRKISLGGKGIEALDGLDALNLSPALSLLATVNTDHTTRPLSPRVLDRAAIVHLTMDPREALQVAQVELDSDQIRAIETLHDTLRRKDASFSVRTAKSLRACLDAHESLALDTWEALDVVLAQEVLSKVRLHARDPLDEGLAESLNQWSQDEGGQLKRCPLLIEEWRELLASGHDVIQA